MADDNGLEILLPKRISKKKVSAANFDVIDSLQWYKDYADVSRILTDQLTNIHDKLREGLVQDVVQFVSRYQYTIERIPVISLFTGFNLSDHSSMISMVADSIKYDKQINCRVVYLNTTKISSLKTFIENVVYDFINYTEDKDDNSFGSEEDINLPAKSKFSLLRLADWYSSSYGSLDELNRIDNDEEFIQLVIVIPDIGLICKEILNDFIRTISCFRNRLPFMFLIGVPYSLNTFEKRFSSDVYSKLAIYPFQSKPSVAFLDKVLEEVFLSKNSVFHIDANVFRLLETAYTSYHYSVKEFIRSIKLSVLEHFSQSPVHATFCCNPENNNISHRIDDLTDEDIAIILDFPSMQKYNTKRKMKKDDILTVSSPNVKDILKNLYNEFKIGVSRFNVAVRCLHLLMKSLKQNGEGTSTRKVYFEVMDPEKRKDWLDTNFMFVHVAQPHALLQALIQVENMLKEYKEREISSIRSKLSSFIKRIEESQRVTKKSPASSPVDSVTPVRIIRTPIKPTRSPAKPTRSPMKVTKSPIKVTKSPVKVTKSPMKMPNTPLSAIRSPLIATNLTPSRSSPLSRRALFSDGLKMSACKEKLQSEFVEVRNDILIFLKQDFFKFYLKSLDDIPLGELFIYKNADQISSAMGNFFLSALNNALETPVSYLECKCCVQNAPDEILKTMPDLAIAFKLHRECGSVINLYDWFQQFRCVVEKKKKLTDDDIDPDIFRRFHLAAQELHLLGYLSQAKKKYNGVEYVSKLVDF